MNMLKGYKQADYSSENWKALLDIKAAADAAVDNAASVADVIAALNNAETAMAAVHTLLDDAKAAAHASLNAALSGYAQGDYSPENWAILLEALATGEPENAASVEDVAAALATAQAAMAAVHTLLTDAKIAAHAALDAALAAYTQADYTLDDWAALNRFKADGDAAVDGAADLDGVQAAQSEASAGMSAVQTIAQLLAAAKAAAHDALAAALGIDECECAGEEEAPAAEAPEEAAVIEGTEVAEAEVAEAATAEEAATVSPEAGDSTPEIVEEKPAETEPAVESDTPAAE